MSRSEKRKQQKASKDWSAKMTTWLGSLGTSCKNKCVSLKNWFMALDTWKKIAILVALVVILTVIIVGAAVWGMASDAIEGTRVETPEDYDLSLTAVDGYINILLLGVDSRDMSNIQGTRSDAIMVVSINEETNDVRVISTYRDTYLKMGDTSTFDKITHACVYGGPEMTMKSLNQAMDLNIENYVVVNFKAVADLVDAVGGIMVDVQDYEIKQLNKYTIQTANNIGRTEYQTVSAPGMQMLDGCQAVSYSRIRKGVGDDFKRTERMRTVLTKVFGKMRTMSFSEIKALIPMMTPQIQHNMEMEDIMALAGRLPSFNILGSTGWPYNVTTGFIGPTSYVLPVDLTANAVKLHQEMFLQEDYVPSSTLTSISAQLAAKIQAARDAQEIEGEEAVEIEETTDPTQLPEDTADHPENSGEEEPPITDHPDTDIPEGEGSMPEDPTVPFDPNAPGTDGTVPADPNTPDTDGAIDPALPVDPTVPEPPVSDGGEANTEPDVPVDPTVPTDPALPDDSTVPTDPLVPDTPEEPADTPVDSGEIQDDPDETIQYDGADEQGVSQQGT